MTTSDHVPSGIAPAVLELLEYPKIVGWLAELTSAPTSAGLARALTPAVELAEVRRRLVELVEGKRLAETRGPWPGPPPFAVAAALDEDLVRGGLLGARALYQVAELLAATARAAAYWAAARACLLYTSPSPRDS